MMRKRVFAYLLCVAMLLSVLPAICINVQAAVQQLEVDIPVDTVIEDNEMMFSFTPEYSGVYVFYSTGDIDTYASLVSDGKVLSVSDDAQPGEYNFSIRYYLSKGSTYFYNVAAYQNGEFRVCITAGEIDSLTVGDKKEMSLSYNKKKKCSFVPKKSGYYCISSYGESDPSVSLYTEDMEYIATSDDKDAQNYNFRLVYFLHQDRSYVYEFTQNSQDTSDFLVLLEEGVGPESVEIVSYPDDMTCIDGAVNETVKLKGLELMYTMTDGSKILWSYEEDNKIGDFFVYRDVCFENEEYFAVLSCGITQLKLKLAVLENPVQSIEIADGYVFEYYEYTCGHNGDYGYYYDYSDDLCNAEIIVNYKDGTKAVSKFCDTLNGIAFSSCDSQQESYFTLGTNYFTVLYAGVSVDVPLTILECPFESVVINSLPVKQYVMGECDYGHYFDKEYLFIPDDFEGLSFTLNLKDGTTITYDNSDFDYTNYELDGYEFYVDEVAAETAGVYKTAINYKNFSIPFDVEVVDHPIEDIKVVQDPNNTVYDSIFMPDFTGMQIEITYKEEGLESEIVTVSKENLSYIGKTPYVTHDGHRIFIDRKSNGTYNLKCYNLRYNYKNIEFLQSKEIISVALCDFSTEIVNMTIEIEFDDKTTQSLLVEDFYPYATNDTEENNGLINGVCVTKSGLVELFAYIDSVDNENDNYVVCLLNKEVSVQLSNTNSVIRGDVDMDGQVTVLDATAIQLHVANIKQLTATQVFCADLDNDNEATVLDAAQIQRFVAEIIDEL